MNYHGTCEVDGNRFTATVTTKRHTEGLQTAFGDDHELKLKLEGTCVGKIATYIGTAEQFPRVLLEGTLILNEQQPPAQQPTEPTPVFNPDRLRNYRGAPLNRTTENVHRPIVRYNEKAPARGLSRAEANAYWTSVDAKVQPRKYMLASRLLLLSP